MGYGHEVAYVWVVMWGCATVVMATVSVPSVSVVVGMSGVIAVFGCYGVGVVV